MASTVFPFGQFWWLYVVFTLGILFLISLDLGVLNRSDREIGFRQALAWTMAWMIFALGFNYFLFQFSLQHLGAGLDASSVLYEQAHARAVQVGLEFLTGYIVEQSLSMDNLFIFVVVFNYFGIPARFQHRVLFYGLLGAIIFRGIFIALGAQLMELHIVNYVFGALLVVTGFKILSTSEDTIEPERNPVIKLLRRAFPVVPELHEGKFFVKQDEKLHLTPLFITLVFLEITDIVFAVDSVPAIFAVTREPLVIFTSNICAILGLRSMYFLLANAMHTFHMLKYGLSVILVFIGIKMALLDQLFGGRFPTHISLIFIACVMALSILLSLYIRTPKGSD